MTARFERQYVRGQSKILREIERAVCGCEYGGTSWTTQREAERVSAFLELSPEKSLVDVGAGAGWPALYMAAISGCQAALVDVPLTGIRIASDRAASDGLAGSCRAVVGDGCGLPFLSGSFHAVSHSDVLCCLERKVAMLRECRRVARADGAMVFTVIEMAPDLSPELRTRVIELGPPFIECERGYDQMLKNAGWRPTQCVDLSFEYARSTRQFVDAWNRCKAEVMPVVGEEEFRDFVDRKGASIPYIEAGAIRRRLYVAVPNT